MLLITCSLLRWNQLILEWKFRDISCIKVLQWNQCPLDASTTKSSKRIQSHSFHSKYARGRFSQDSNLQARSQGLGLTILLVVPFVLYIWTWALSSAFNHLVAQTQSTLGWMSFVSIYLGRQACGGPYLSLFGQNMDTFKAQFPTPWLWSGPVKTLAMENTLPEHYVYAGYLHVQFSMEAIWTD